MLKLEEIKKDSQIVGIVPNEVATVLAVNAVGADAVTVYYKTASNPVREQMLFRNDEARLSLAQQGRPWSFDSSGAEFKLALEAFRIRLAHLFDPMMAIHTSNVDPYPHQISAVYEVMLPRQPLRFVLADDPGAGKTIMAGLLIRELLMRADAKRILIVSPGSLTEQWQDEMLEKFGVQFELFSKEKQNQSAIGNYFDEQNLIIARLDQLARSEEIQEKLKVTDWDLIIVDEAHKMSANYFGSKVNKTQRFVLGELLGSITRHFLLMTATPHNGKEEDFQIWLSLLDGDRFYGKFRDGVKTADISDIMRRMVKEELLKFDGTPLFPERKAYTANYELSAEEASLYDEVTRYVRDEMNRADRLADNQRRGRVGFALTMLQRRLASSPEAIYQSLKRRRERMETRLKETKLEARAAGIAKRGFGVGEENDAVYYVEKKIDVPDNIDEIEEELTPEEYENYADRVVDQATASETITELEAEISSLTILEHKALMVKESGNDRKWEELSKLLQDKPEMYTSGGARRKLIIFTEHRDTLSYLMRRISGMLGNAHAVVAVHGGTNRDERRKIQEMFRFDPVVLVMVATDAAGEGVNLQNANLMVNYDLPWNPNRLEQRFGRIHRIGQKEVCHLWNMVANETREGEVFQTLFNKLENEKAALGGRVFDILGEAFDNVSLKDLLIEAIRYGERPEVKNRLNERVKDALDHSHLLEIIKRNSLVDQHMTPEMLFEIKDEMDRAEARKLQPCFIRAFFIEAFKSIGGDMREREKGRYQIKNVPAIIRSNDRIIGETRTPVLREYERICFDKSQVTVPNKPMAALLHPGHPLMHALSDYVLLQHREKLKPGAVLIDPADDGIEPSLIFMIDHSIRENTADKLVSRRLQFVKITASGLPVNAGWAPHLDLDPATPEAMSVAECVMSESWLTRDLEQMAVQYAAANLAPEHYLEVQKRRENQVRKIQSAVHERLVSEINYWSSRYLTLEEDVKAGKQPRMQPLLAKQRAEELTARLQLRTRELEAMRNVVSNTPVVIGGALIIPRGLLDKQAGRNTFCADADARTRVEQLAMQTVMNLERSFGHQVVDVSACKCGWDVTAKVPRNDADPIKEDRHIEVKGRAKGADTVTLTCNEIAYAVNQQDKFILSIVLVDGESVEGPYYIKNPFEKEIDFGIASVNYKLDSLLVKAVKPEMTL